jgi:zinc protease
MKNFRILLLFTAALLFTLPADAQKPEKIIAKYVKAIGGKKKLAQMTSLYTESEADIQGMTSIQKTTILNGKGYRMDMEMMGAVITNCITPDGGWTINPMAGGNAPMDMPEEQYNGSKDEIFIGGPFTVVKTRGYTAEALGTEKAGDVEAIKIKLTSPEGSSAVHYFDPESYYLIKTVASADMQGQPMDIILKFADYKDVEGMMIPHELGMSMGGMFEMNSEVTKVEIDKPVDPAFFEKP